MLAIDERRSVSDPQKLENQMDYSEKIYCGFGKAQGINTQWRLG